MHTICRYSNVRTYFDFRMIPRNREFIRKTGRICGNRVTPFRQKDDELTGTVERNSTKGQNFLAKRF